MEQIKAKLANIIYQAEDSRYTVAAMQRTDDYSLFKCLGYLPFCPGVSYLISGDWVNSPEYGRQFKADSFQEITDGKHNVIAILMTLPGIKRVKAELIYNKFGEDSLHVIESEPRRLSCIRGISEKAADNIGKAYAEQHEAMAIYSRLGKYGITYPQCVRLTAAYKPDTWKKISADPYRLCDIKGIEFPIADRVALNEMGIDQHDPRRAAAAARYILQHNEGASGDTWMEDDAFMDAFSQALGFDAEASGAVQDLLINRIIHIVPAPDGGYAVQRDVMYECEHGSASILLSMLEYRPVPEIHSIILDACAERGISLDSIQEQAVQAAIENTASIITGGPGTGKTTVAGIIISVWKRLTGKPAVLLAPTGRAARALSEHTGTQARTIHSALGIYDSDDGIAQDSGKQISDSLVIVDEMGMVDIYLMYRLLSSLDHCHIVFIGDPDQLQPIGPGAVLRDMAGSGTIPVTSLVRLYRQGEGSAILENAAKIREGRTDLKEGSDFWFCESQGEHLENLMVSLTVEAIHKFGAEHVMCISPMKDHAAGVIVLNGRIRDAVNPPAPDKPEFPIGKTLYRLGDRVMQLKNTPAAVNGDIGTVVRIDKDYMEADFGGGKRMEYRKQDYESVGLAYAMTVHKAQGSEADCVITCIQDRNGPLLRRPLLYTAATRAKKLCVCLGSRHAIAMAISNDDKALRKTLLSGYLAQMDAAGRSPSEMEDMDGKEKRIYNGTDGQLPEELYT